MHTLIERINKKQIIIYIILAFCFFISLVFVYHNESFYKNPIAEVVKTKLVDSSEMVDTNENKDHLYTQEIEAEIKNGDEKGKLIHLTNEYTKSGAYDQGYHVGNELFVYIDKATDNGEYVGTIKDLKRDQYLSIIGWAFIFILLIVGKKQGLFSIISLAVNAIILSYALDIYLNFAGSSLLVICSVSVILFTVISLLLVNGFNEKTYAAIIATLLGTFVSLLIAYLVMWVTKEQGLRYEEIQFITRPYKMVFMAGLFIGSLGAVMDVAITLSSSIFGLYEKDNDISIQVLKKSGLEIGKDIMGTMTNILFFVYISGTIPMLILYLKNASSLGFTLNMNLSLELARALAGGIGIVITIPIALYTTIFFVKRKKARL
ncbi:YibE/F family protein [Robertmurraya kyonggiensis]|uniref:YibE/F family protein n=1 Tax=Robertmurraya kyonggiensis TaxID=1037680 RepID=A0A4U1D8N9_9BACI|nr:YibE/F family protein [Robertmurraya kyonggiensis]TKC18872.1 YibE/F family protein [Robertmurraya kyonggiensis]